MLVTSQKTENSPKIQVFLKKEEEGMRVGNEESEAASWGEKGGEPGGRRGHSLGEPAREVRAPGLCAEPGAGRWEPGAPGEGGRRSALWPPLPPRAPAAERAAWKSRGSSWARGGGGLPAGPGRSPGPQAATKPPPARCVARSVGERGAGSRGAHGEREAQEGPQAAHHLLQLPAGRPAAPLPEGPVPGAARARRAGRAAGPHADTGQSGGHLGLRGVGGAARGTPDSPGTREPEGPFKQTPCSPWKPLPVGRGAPQVSTSVRSSRLAPHGCLRACATVYVCGQPRCGPSSLLPNPKLPQSPLPTHSAGPSLDRSPHVSSQQASMCAEVYVHVHTRVQYLHSCSCVWVHVGMRT